MTLFVSNLTTFPVKFLMKSRFLIQVLESAVRFGTAVLVQDVETLDPILNPILNR